MRRSNSLLGRERSFLEDVAFEMRCRVSQVHGMRKDIPSLGLSLQMAWGLVSRPNDGREEPEWEGLGHLCPGTGLLCMSEVEMAILMVSLIYSCLIDHFYFPQQDIYWVSFSIRDSPKQNLQWKFAKGATFLPKLKP